MKKIIAVMAAVLFLAGCGDTVHSWQLNLADKFCKEHGGIDNVETSHFPLVDPVESYTAAIVTCHDGRSSHFYDLIN